jgi:hypothetical protein
MKTMNVLAVLVASSVMTSVWAGDEMTKDVRVDVVLKELKYGYDVSSAGYAKLVMGGFDGDRTQLVMVNSDTDILNEYESRKVWTVAYMSETPLSDDKVRMLMEKNGEYKLGAWSLQKVNSKYGVVYTVQIPANANARVLSGAITAVELAGDRMEHELTGKDDF